MHVQHTAAPLKQRIGRAFGRKAAAYWNNATVQTGLAELVARRLADSGRLHGRCVDLGCGIGTFADACARNRLPFRVVGVDLSFDALAMLLKRAPLSSAAVQADIDSLPFTNAQFDAAVTASSLQWIGNVPETLKKIAAILKNGGVFGFSVFVRGSFRELISVQQRFGIATPVQCPEAAQFISLLEEAGFRDVGYDTVERTVYAPTAAMVIKSISSIGSCATAAARLLNRKEIAGFCRAYEASFKNSSGVPLTYRSVVGSCRKRSA